MNTDKATLYGRPTFTFGPELLTMYPRMTGDKAPFKVFKNYRFFSKMYDGEYLFGKRLSKFHQFVTEAYTRTPIIYRL